MSGAVVALALTLLSASSALEEEPRPVRVAVYDLKVDGVDERVGRVVTDAIVAEVRKRQRVAVVSMDEVRAMLDLEAQKALMGCSDDSCLSEIADSLGVDQIVIGSLARVGEESIFSLRLLDQREAEALGQVNQRLAGAGGEEFLAMVGPAVSQLFGDRPLREGQSEGVAPELALRVNPPPLPPWVFWATAATSGALVVAAGATLVINTVLWSQVSDRQEQARKTPVPGDELVALRSQNDLAAVTTIALVGTSALVGATAGALTLFTDWHGYGEE